VFWKRAGRRPALQKTREHEMTKGESEEKRGLRQKHTHTQGDDLTQIWPEGTSEASFWASGRPGYRQNDPQKYHFAHLGGLAPDMARMNLRGIIFSIWAAWPQIWPEWASEASFWASGRPDSRYGQNERQRHHFEHLAGLAANMVRMRLRGIILSIWKAICQKHTIKWHPMLTFTRKYDDLHHICQKTNRKVPLLTSNMSKTRRKVTSHAHICS
jgi:hypothetical protein